MEAFVNRKNKLCEFSINKRFCEAESLIYLLWNFLKVSTIFPDVSSLFIGKELSFLIPIFRDKDSKMLYKYLEIHSLLFSFRLSVSLFMAIEWWYFQMQYNLRTFVTNS